MTSRSRASLRALPKGALRLALRGLVSLPRRQLDLQRWVGGREFGELHEAAATWLARHFQVIEEGVPWLERVGSDTLDFCNGKVSNAFLRFAPGHGATAACVREVTAVYGFGGPLSSRLVSLGEALSAVGWNSAGPNARRRECGAQDRWMADGMAILRWQPVAALSYPAGGDGTPPWGRPPLSPGMRMSWSSRGQEIAVRANPGKIRQATRNYLPLEASKTDVPELLRRALDHHENALTVTIHLLYYSNPNARRRPHRIPTHLIPTRREA
jgi:hypothetical protein